MITRLALLSAAGLALGAAKGDVAAELIGGGVLAALLVLIGLPVGLLLFAAAPRATVRMARAAGYRWTASLLVGAGVFVVGFVLVAATADRAPRATVLVLGLAYALFLAGFSGCAWVHGERMLGRTDAPLRAFVLGWLARAGAFAPPVLWPVLAVYLAVGALGVPIVALFARRSLDGMFAPPAS